MGLAAMLIDYAYTQPYRALMKNLSIRAKLITLFTAFIAVNSLFIFLYFPSRLGDQAIKASIDKANTIAAMTAFSVSSHLAEGHSAAIDDALQSVSQNKDIVYVIVLDPAEQITAHLNKAKADMSGYRLADSRDRITEDGDLYRTVTPITYRGRLLGRLYLGLSLRQVQAEIRWSVMTIGLVSLAIFVIGVFAVYGISLMATGSLRHVVQVAERIARGDVKRRAVVHTKDEVGYLARSFNQMVDRLESTRREMEQLNRTLESRVKERTKELLLEITERKQAEEKVREQAALLNISQDAILVRDLEDTILFWNQGAQNLYGWSSDEVIGKKAATVLHNSNEEQIKQVTRLLGKTGEWRGELRQVTKNGKELIVESRWTVVRDNSGSPKSVLVVNTDITEKKMLEKQFLRTQRMESIGTLAGGIAHDLNNVLAPILIAVEVFRKRFTDENSQRMLQSLELSAKRGAEMVKQVLTFARGADGERVNLQPKHLVNEMKNIVQETFPRSIEIVTNVPRDLWILSGDATQFHQVLLNLSVNARDAMPNGGTLTISARNVHVDDLLASQHEGAKAGRYVMLSVADTGTGIPPEIMDKIFEPFFTTKETGAGTGLGLPTVLSIVRGHGGFLTLKSTLDKGTEFCAYLPAAEQDEALGTSEASSSMPMGNGELVLIVDDEAAICQITKATLESFGYQTVTAGDGTEAVAIHSKLQGTIKVILTDMMMPIMNGPDMVRLIRSIDPDVKIVASSGLTSGYTALDAESVDAILPKPYTADMLLTTIRDLLHVEAEAA